MEYPAKTMAFGFPLQASGTADQQKVYPGESSAKLSNDVIKGVQCGIDTVKLKVVNGV